MIWLCRVFSNDVHIIWTVICSCIYFSIKKYTPKKRNAINTYFERYDKV